MHGQSDRQGERRIRKETLELGKPVDRCTEMLRSSLKILIVPGRIMMMSSVHAEGVS